MKTLVSILLSFALLANVCGAGELVTCSKGKAPAKLAAAKGPLSVSKLSSTINWKVPPCKAMPYGYGTFSFKATTTVSVTDLTTLAGDMSGYLYFVDTGWMWNAWSDWIKKGDSKKRSYVYKSKSPKESYSVSLKLKDGVLTITVRDNLCPGALVGATNVDTGGTITRTYNLELSWNDAGAVEVVDAICAQACDYKTVVDKKTTIKKQKVTCK